MNIKKNNLFLHNEYISLYFSFILTTTAFYINTNYNLVVGINEKIWITFYFVILSLSFNSIISLVLKRLMIYIPYFSIISPILFWIILIFIPVIPFVFICTLGLIFKIYISWNTIRLKVHLFSIIFSLLYFFIIGSESWNMHRSLLPVNSLILQSSTGTDITFFSSLTSMLKTYNSCSTGIDGIKSFSYHYGIYYFFSKISTIIGVDSIHTNNLISPLILLPTSLFISLEVLKYFKKYIFNLYDANSFFLNRRDHFIFACLLTTLTNAPFGMPFVANLSFFTSPFQIDSQLIATLFLSIIIIITIQFHKNNNKSIFIDIVLLCIFQFLISFTKSPASHLSLFLFLYATFRYSIKRDTIKNYYWIITSIVMVISSFYLNYTISITSFDDKNILNFEFFKLWKDTIPLREWQWIFLSNGFYTFASIIIIACLRRDVSSFQILKTLFNTKFNIFELFLCLTIISISLTSIFGGGISFASTYYLDSVKYVSLIFLTACLSLYLNRIKLINCSFTSFLKNNSPIHSIILFVICFLFVSGSAISLKGWERMLSNCNQCTHAKFINQNEIEAKTEMINTLIKIAKVEQNKTNTCIWIPKSNSFFWKDLASKEQYAFIPFWAVSLSEIAMIDGFPITNNLNGMFGYKVFDQQRSKSINSISLNEIKEKARILGFKYLIVLTDNKNFNKYSLDDY